MGSTVTWYFGFISGILIENRVVVKVVILAGGLMSGVMQGSVLGTLLLCDIYK